MVAVTETSLLLQTKPATTGAKIGSGDWKLHVERLAGDDDGGVWDIDTWSVDGAPDVAGEWASLGWETLNHLLRGMEWTRGADQPNGRPRNGEIALTLLNEMDGANDPWVNYGNTRPGVIIRAGITSATDVRADGWIPLWAGIVESWTPKYEGARDSGYRADSFAEVRLVETLAWLARIDNDALGSAVGSGEVTLARIDRLLTAAEWPFGLVSLFGSGGAPAVALQSTDMNANRLTELYLTADSSNAVVMSDVTGAALVTDRSLFKASRLSEFSVVNFGGGNQPMVIYAGVDAAGSGWFVAYNPDTFETVNDPEGVVNDHRYTRVGGTQQIFEHPISIGQFGRVQRVRGDLIMTTDGAALAQAEADNDREARTALRVDNLEVVATGNSIRLLMVAATDCGDGAWVFPPAAVGFAGSGTGTIRSMSHTITPMKGRVHWTASYAVDFYNYVNLPGSILPEA